MKFTLLLLNPNRLADLEGILRFAPTPKTTISRILISTIGSKMCLAQGQNQLMGFKPLTCESTL